MKPKKIFLIRHGESEGNINKDVYRKTPDYAVRLTNNGIGQALIVGEKIQQTIQTQDYGVYYSPYFRARQTMELAIRNIGKKSLSFAKEEPRIREQEYSGGIRNFDRIDFEKEREAYGKFFYRLNGGESGADVFDRVSDFIGTLHRDFQKKNFPKNCLIFSHGMTNRVFIMRFFHYLVEDFEMWKNPNNGEIYILELQKNNKYKLITEIPKHEKGYGLKYEK